MHLNRFQHNPAVDPAEERAVKSLLPSQRLVFFLGAS